jgi:hypothetical protein
MSTEPKQYLNSNKTARRYGVSKRTIARWQQDPSIGFPRPAVSINGRNYHDEAQLDQFDRECVLKATAGRASAARQPDQSVSAGQEVADAKRTVSAQTTPDL